MSIGSRLREARHDIGFSQAEVSRKTRIHKTQIYGYEKDNYCPSATRLIKLCKLYNVSADYILGLKEYDE